MTDRKCNTNTIEIMGSRVNLVNLAQITKIVSRWIDTHGSLETCRRIVVTGFHGIWEAHQNKNFKAILNSSDLWVPDGIAPVIMAKLRGFKSAVRTPGAEIMQAFFEIADQKGYSSYFYGDTEETLRNLRAKLQEKYPGHKIAGMYSPPFRALTHEEDTKIIQMINDAKPDILWIALGMPKQDQWIFDRKDRLKVPVAAGVGAAFAFLSGDVKRVPEWIGKFGLEWLWRFLQEPNKLWRRDLIDGPKFLLHAVLDLSGLREYDR
jgi:N-acetylglucosaminyldiphosphoundecaprenol N-acetyl-beta-D-mannosaminyltransferase